MGKRKITASIVLHNPNIPQVETVIDSYCPSEDRKLYFIDNSPNISEEFAQKDNGYIKYYFSGKNIGYGSAHNVGIKRAIKDGSDFHIVLNPDIQFETRVVDELADFMEKNTNVVNVMPKIISPDGDTQYLCKLLPTPLDLISRRFFPKNYFTEKMNGKYILKNSDYNKIMNIPCLSGCFMFLRVDKIKEHDLFFDERFFIYCEDFDYSRRLHSVGETVFYPNVNVMHDHGKKSYKSTRILIHHVQSAVKYFMKWGWFFDEERKVINIECLKQIERINRESDR